MGDEVEIDPAKVREVGSTFSGTVTALREQTGALGGAAFGPDSVGASYREQAAAIAKGIVNLVAAHRNCANSSEQLGTGYETVAEQALATDNTNAAGLR